jgi:hypothetical protein
MALTFPHGAAPAVALWFIPFGNLPAFLDGRQEGALPFPPDLSPFTKTTLQASAGPGGGQTLRFQTGGEEGLFLAVVKPADGTAEFSVAIASRVPTKFPRPGVTDLTEIVVPYVNCSDRHGLCFLVLGADWFAEHMLNITVTEQGAPPPWAPLDAESAGLLASGRGLAGVDRIWLTPPGGEDDDGAPCIDLSAIRETPL